MELAYNALNAYDDIDHFRSEVRKHVPAADENITPDQMNRRILAHVYGDAK
ncbi:MAG: hypothetical protein KDE54_08545 [Caldilineaceae bacterium]|nr:hypothetical protein [Caldilineaceae bacterium]MCB0144504.1 hypothetical protein [Caldilineaceae bacterium]